MVGTSAVNVHWHETATDAHCRRALRSRITGSGAAGSETGANGIAAISCAAAVSAASASAGGSSSVAHQVSAFSSTRSTAGGVAGVNATQALAPTTTTRAGHRPVSLLGAPSGTALALHRIRRNATSRLAVASAGRSANSSRSLSIASACAHGVTGSMIESSQSRPRRREATGLRDRRRAVASDASAIAPIVLRLCRTCFGWSCRARTGRLHDTAEAGCSLTASTARLHLTQRRRTRRRQNRENRCCLSISQAVRE